MKAVLLLGVVVLVMTFAGCWDMNQAIGKTAGGPARGGSERGSEGGGT